MSTVDLVERRVLDDMLGGLLAPGTRIRQDDLADRMGVSKIPVREALQRLTAIGLLRFETNRGAVVPALSLEEADENYTLRRAIERELLARAIPRMSIVDLAEADLVLAEADANPTQANWRFHRALYRASGWRRGIAMAEVLHASVAPYVLLYLQSLGGGTDSDGEHRALVEACRAGDVTAALDTLEVHLANAASALTSFLAPATDTPG